MLGAAWLVGLALLVAYFVLERRLPRGPQEFVTWPPLEPLPYAPLRGFTFEQLARTVYRALVLGPALLLLSVGVARLLPDAASGRLTARRIAIGAAVGAVALSGIFMFGVLDGRALLDDELTYAMQADLLNDGLLADPTLPQFVREPFTIFTRRGVTGKYLFGEPLIQTVGVRIGYPGVLHLPLLALALIAWYAQLARLLNPKTAAWATTFVALSPMVVVNSGTGLTHTTALACVAIAGLGWSWIAKPLSDREPLVGALLLGLALGFLGTVRPQVAVPVAAVLGVAAGWRLLREWRWGALAVLGGSLLVWGAAIAAYDLWLSGSPTTLPWFLFQPREAFGFGHVLQGSDYEHTVARAVENLAVTAVRLDSWWLGWPVSVIALCGLLVARRGERHGSALWLGVGAAVIVFNLFYYSTGVSETGPIYHFELVLPLSLLAAASILAALERWPRLVFAGLLVHLVLGTGTFLWEKASRLDWELDMIHGAGREALRVVDAPALLFYEVAPQETLRLGWLNGGFPVRYRSDRRPVVTYPRSGAASVQALRERYPERSCWYFRTDPATLGAQLLRCAEAEALLARPSRLPGPWIALRSTAMRRGLLDPMAGVDR